MLHWGLYGILLTQVYIYHLSFPRDPKIAKAFVYVTFMIETVQTIIITKTAWHVFAVGYGDYSVYDAVEMGWFNIPLIGGTVAFIAQIFYAYRIRLLSRSFIMPAVITFFALLQLSGALASATILERAGQFSHLSVREYAITAGVGSSFLSRSRSKQMSSTQILLRRLITVVIETGVVTATIVTLNLVLSMLPNHIMYYMATSEIIAKVYSNSMLVLLNSRIRFSSAEDEEDHHGPPVCGAARRGEATQRRGTSAIHFPIPPQGIMVSREEMVFSSPKSWLDKTEEDTSATTSIDEVGHEHGKPEVDV
ncbi:hypothetical protein D9619_005020 [Psilocybe cf. subviscida]|uniref:DUF6534 domain-containing protein n=1 Tax=Psilocybe cf. subviscida TaxID=2480587 RepID=A0A8H5BRX1_9AGAR|nr:hypothetical protein D9619_005020 [Psilocybe cf. subviscida]